MASNKKAGSIMIYVVVIIGVVGMLYSSIYVLMATENRINISLTNRVKAYYIAESGLDRGIAFLKQDIVAPFTCQNPFAPQYKSTHQFDVVVVQVQPSIYKITSIGTYDNAKRTLEATVFKTVDEFLIQFRQEIN